MKRKLLIGALAFVGGLTVVGSGFSAWYFGSTELTKDNAINHYVTDIADNIGTLTDLNESDKLYIILDQGGYKNASDATKGVSITKSETTPTDEELGDEVTTIGAKYEISKENFVTLHDAGIKKGTFTATLSLSTAAQTYLKFVASPSVSVDTTVVTGGLTRTDTTLTYTYDVDFTATVTDDYSKSFTFDSSTTDTVNALLQYNTKPATKEAYEAMKTALGTESLLTINYSFKIVEE